MIEFDHNNSASKLFKGNGEANNPSTDEGLDKEPRLLGKVAKPCPDVGYKPGLAPRIAKWASLRDLCHIDDRGLVLSFWLPKR